MYSIPLKTKPVTAIPAKVASRSLGKGSGSSGNPTATRATLVLRPSSLQISEFTITLPLIAGLRLRSFESRATPKRRIGVTSICMRLRLPIVALTIKQSLNRIGQCPIRLLEKVAEVPLINDVSPMQCMSCSEQRFVLSSRILKQRIAIVQQHGPRRDRSCSFNGCHVHHPPPHSDLTKNTVCTASIGGRQHSVTTVR